jgi:hypothetical protein
MRGDIDMNGTAPGACPKTPFSPISSLNSKKLSSKYNDMPPVIFSSLPRSEKKLLFSDNLLKKTNEEIKQLMKFEFALLTSIIIAVTIVFATHTDEWITVIKIGAALLTSVTLLVPLIFTWAKQLVIKLAMYH